MATFFQANGYFQIKSNEAFTAPDSQDFKNLEKLETEGYERAKIHKTRDIERGETFFNPPRWRSW